MLEEFELFHDAIIERTEIEWFTGNVKIFFILNETYAKNGIKWGIKCENFYEINLTRRFEWGQSQFVNEIQYCENVLKIEMQSGDYITIFCNFEEIEVFPYVELGVIE
jgi:hypothetical protein